MDELELLLFPVFFSLIYWSFYLESELIHIFSGG